MYKYRKKPVVIEAFQMTKERRKDSSKWPTWLLEAFTNKIIRTRSTGDLIIKTLEGDHLVSYDDFIVQGVKGELYPCKPDIFKATHDKEF